MSASLLNCGCMSSGVEYSCLNCRNTRCEAHRDNAHFCPVCPGCEVRHGYPVHEWDPVTRRLTVIGGRS